MQELSATENEISSKFSVLDLITMRDRPIECRIQFKPVRFNRIFGMRIERFGLEMHGKKHSSNRFDFDKLFNHLNASPRINMQCGLGYKMACRP